MLLILVGAVVLFAFNAKKTNPALLGTNKAAGTGAILGGISGNASEGTPEYGTPGYYAQGGSSEATPRNGTIPNDTSSSGNNGTIGGDPNAMGQSAADGGTYSHVLNVMDDYPAKPGYSPPGTAESAGGSGVTGGPKFNQSQRLTDAATKG